MRRAKVPQFKRHNNGQGYARYNGKCYYFGKFGTPETQMTCQAWLAKVVSQADIPTTKPERVAKTNYTVADLVRQFLVHAQTYYADSGEAKNFRFALQALLEVCGRTAVGSLTKAHLREFINSLVGKDLARTTINSALRRVKHTIKWGAQNDLVPAEIHAQMMLVPALQKGRTKARETEPVGSVPVERVEAILPYVSRQIGGVIRFCLLTGARPGEALALTWSSINRSGNIWLCRPECHKTAHKGIRRTIVIGPKVQGLLAQFEGNGSQYVFSPRQSLTESGNDTGNRSGSDQYHYCSLTGAIRKGCEKAFDCPHELRIVALKQKRGESATAFADRKQRASEWRADNVWSPNQLRHTFATLSRQRDGLEVTQIALGHTSARTREIYAEPDISAAIDYARKWG